MISFITSTTNLKTQFTAMNIPNKIIETILSFPSQFHASLFHAVIEYMRTRSIIDNHDDQTAILFDEILRELDPILRRRERAAEYRRRRKERMLQTLESHPAEEIANNADILSETASEIQSAETESSDIPPTAPEEMPRHEQRSTPNRRMRRLIARLKEKQLSKQGSSGSPSARASKKRRKKKGKKH